MNRMACLDETHVTQWMREHRLDRPIEIYAYVAVQALGIAAAVLLAMLVNPLLFIVAYLARPLYALTRAMLDARGTLRCEWAHRSASHG